MYGYAITVITACILIALAELILPDSEISKYAKVAFGILFVIVIIKPIINVVQSDQSFEKIFETNVKEFETKYQTSDVNKAYFSSVSIQLEQRLSEHIEKVVEQNGGELEKIDIKTNKNYRSDNFGTVEYVCICVSQIPEQNIQKITNEIKLQFNLNDKNLVIKVV